MGVHYKLHHLLGNILVDGNHASLKNSEGQELSFPSQSKELRVALCALSKEHLSELRAKNVALTKEAVKKSVMADILVIQGIKSLADMDKAINMLVNRLRDWYELYLPEYSAHEKDSHAFVKGVLVQHKEEFLKKLGKDSFGADLSASDLKPLHQFAQELLQLQAVRVEMEQYLDHTMKLLCPNLRAIAGVLIGAKLLEHAGSLKRMAEMPSSTIQILGAEKALFRHLKTGSRPPKYGVLLGHSIVQQMPKAKQGKAARVLADKISLAVRIDYFKGEFRGEQLLLDVKKKLDKEHSKTSKPKKKFIEPRSESRFEKGSFEKPFRPFKPRY